MSLPGGPASVAGSDSKWVRKTLTTPDLLEKISDRWIRDDVLVSIVQSLKPQSCISLKTTNLFYALKNVIIDIGAGDLVAPNWYVYQTKAKQFLSSRNRTKVKWYYYATSSCKIKDMPRPVTSNNPSGSHREARFFISPVSTNWLARLDIRLWLRLRLLPFFKNPS